MNNIKIIFSLYLLVSVFSLKSQNADDRFYKLDKYLQKAMADWNVPGMSIAIVNKDSILWTGSYGVADVRNKQAVDSHTLFAVASNTKSFTSAALAMLVDDGIIHWDDKVVKHLPWFQMYDPYVTGQMTIRDLLTHRSGLKTFSGDLIWYGSNYSREEVIRKAAFLKPAFGFREQFGYSNIMYMAAGEIIPAVTGFSWEEYIRHKLLYPLQMNRSVLSVAELEGMDNVAQPHTYINNQAVAIPWLDWDNMGPAGSLISSAHDMSNWLIMNLNEGVFKQDTMLSDQRIFEMQTAITSLPVSKAFNARFPSTHFRAYGLGWSLMDYLGHKIITHNGGYDGMISQTIQIPEAGLGCVILTNSLSNLYYPVMYTLLDLLLHNPANRDWSSEILEQVKKGEQTAEAKKSDWEGKRKTGTKPSVGMDVFSGYYGCPIYDTVEVYRSQGTLFMQFSRSEGFRGRLTHWHFDTFELEFPDFPSLPKGYVTFFLNREGKPDELQIYLDNPDFDFTELELKRLN
jgi:CubicO group peptidase (beta-lactamase class C family)